MILKWNEGGNRLGKHYDARTPLGYYIVRDWGGKCTAASYPASSTSMKVQEYSTVEEAQEACNDHWLWLGNEIVAYNMSSEPYDISTRKLSPEIRTFLTIKSDT